MACMLRLADKRERALFIPRRRCSSLLTPSSDSHSRPFQLKRDADERVRQAEDMEEMRERDVDRTRDGRGRACH